MLQYDGTEWVRLLVPHESSTPTPPVPNQPPIGMGRGSYLGPHGLIGRPLTPVEQAAVTEVLDRLAGGQGEDDG